MIIEAIQNSINVKQRILADPQLLKMIEQAAEATQKSLSEGGKVIFSGNGGSFADSQHLSAEFTSRLMFDRSPLSSIALGCNSSSMSAIGNDYGFDQVFSREIEVLGTSKDVYFPISTSGNSPNILKSIEVASKNGLTIFGLTGYTGGQMKSLCNCICVPSDETARIQESHILIGHIICELVEKNIFQPA